MGSISVHRPEENELTLAEAMELVGRNRWLIFYSILAFTIIATVCCWVVPKQYKAVIVISPVSDSQSGNQNSGLGGLASQFSGLASLAGVSLPGNSRKYESLAVLESDELTKKFIEDKNLLPVLYASMWDFGRLAWKDPEDAPTVWKANDRFKKRIRTISNDSKTGIVKMTIKWKNPQQAADWANELVRRANERLKNKALEEAEKNIAYLNDQAAKTDVVPLKQAIYSMLQTEINKAMAARGSEEYAFKVLDPASKPERQAYPLKRYWIPAGAFLGLFLSVFFVILRAALQPK